MEIKKEYDLKVGDRLIANYGGSETWDNVLVEVLRIDGKYLKTEDSTLVLCKVSDRSAFCYVPDAKDFYCCITHYFPKSREIELNFGEEK